jgi:isoleucyl-tRNA synthetase
MSPKFAEIKQLNYPKMELEMLRWWKENKIFEQSMESRADGIPFTFYEGPPTANGKPGIHHVMARTVKDLFCRYRTLKGFSVDRKGGWDTHGLPVEIEVEKALGLEGRSQVEEYGIAKYNAACRESVLKYKDLWDQLTDRMGYWVDLENPYITFENNYIESVWWAIKRLHEKGLLYKGYKIQWYSPGSGTVLSSHEVSLGYKETQDPSITVKFRTSEDADTYFLAWTTTPWTVISNVALCVNPVLNYVKVALADSQEKYILAEATAPKVLANHEYTVVESFTGKDLLGKTYHPIFDYAKQEIAESEAWRIIPADYVTTDDGTGIVHTAPAFGADDFTACKLAGIPLFNPVNRDGCFTEVVTEFAGQWFKDADKHIAKAIKEKGAMFKHETYVHNYPFDWRKDTPLMSYPVDSWFIKTTAVKEKMVSTNEKIGWKPASTGTGRFGTWLENNVDWAISRQRFWGSPLPIWVADDDPEYLEVIGSIEELCKKSGLDPKDDSIDLHRPFIDEVTWPSPNGGTMRRVPDLIDVWFDSGAMPFAQWHYPFENRDKFDTNFPADFIAEGVDQTRGWFYTLHALGNMLFDKAAYRNVVSNGLVLDAKGEKMSKSKGNTVDPFEVINEFGADATRWYMMSNSSPWENLKFSLDGLKEAQRKYLSTIMNTWSFFAMYANIDGFSYTGVPFPTADRPEMDRWIISRLNSTVKQVDEFLDQYEPTKAIRCIEEFIEELSNWYVRRSRRRFWGEGTKTEIASAYQSLLECLLALSKLVSPFAPYFAEWIYQRINEVVPQEEASVHLSFFPSVEETAINKKLEKQMLLARLITTMVLKIRNHVNINVRQPLARIMVNTASEEEHLGIEAVRAIILEEVNVKELTFVDSSSDVVTKSAQPNFKLLGKKLGKQMKEIGTLIKELDNEAIAKLEKTGTIELASTTGQVFSLNQEEILIQSAGLQGWEVESEQGLTIALDTRVTDELLTEGLAREFINRVQNMRKEADFDVTDHIDVGFVTDNDTLSAAIMKHSAYITGETLTDNLVAEALKEADFTKEWQINEFVCLISVKKNLQN